MKGHNFFSIEIFLMMDKRFEMEQKRHRHKHMYMSLVSTISFYTWEWTYRMTSNERMIIVYMML